MAALSLSFPEGDTSLGTPRSASEAPCGCTSSSGLLCLAPVFTGTGWGVISSSCQNILGACLSWTPPGREWEPHSWGLEPLPSPPPPNPGPAWMWLQGTGGHRSPTRAEHHPEAESRAKWQPQKGAGAGGPRAWSGRGRLRGRFVHVFGVDQTRMGGSLLSPRYSAGEAFIQPFLHSSS